MYCSRFELPDWGDFYALTERLENPTNNNIKLVELKLSRSLIGFNFTPKMSAEDFQKVDKQVREAIQKLDSRFSGLHLSLDSESWSTEMVANLSADHLLFDHEAPLYELPVR